MIEDVVKQVKTFLQTNMPGKLDTIDTERNDGITLDDIQGYFVEREHQDPSYPNITVVSLETSTGNILSSRRELRHRISVEITDRTVSVDTDILQKKLWRYVEAVERLVGTDPTLSGNVIDSAIVSHEYPKESARADAFVKSARVVLTALERPSVGAY